MAVAPNSGGGWLAQVLNAFSRMGASVLTFVPPLRGGHFSDQALLARVLQRPQSSLDALSRGAIELSTGVITGLSGIVLDPIQVSPHPLCQGSIFSALTEVGVDQIN